MRMTTKACLYLVFPNLLYDLDLAHIQCTVELLKINWTTEHEVLKSLVDQFVTQTGLLRLYTPICYR